MNISDWYWIVGDTNPTTQVYSTASNAFVANNAAAYLSWLSSPIRRGFNDSGTIRQITAAADNGSGKTRLTVPTTADLQTGQYFNFDANGNQQITVIDSTHIDLTGVSFSSYVATTSIVGPTIIATAAALQDVIDRAAFGSFDSGTNLQNLSNDTTLTNPLDEVTRIVMNAANKKVSLPPMNNPQSPPKGKPFIIANVGNGSTNYPFTLYLNDGTTALKTIDEGFEVELISIGNSTKNGSFYNNGILRQTAPQRAGGRVVGLVAANTGGSPTTQMTVSADLIEFSNSTTRNTFSMEGGSVSGLTVDVTTAGPIVGGRDQAGAFSANSFVHIHAICDGEQSQNVNLLASASATAPTLPAGYTHSTYLFPVRFNGSSQLVSVHVRGDTVYYDAAQTALSSGTATSETAVSVSSLVPSNASTMILNTDNAMDANGGGDVGYRLKLRHTSGSDYFFQQVIAPAANAHGCGAATVVMPQVSQQFYYLWVNTFNSANLSALNATVYVEGYRCPNGGN
jgi:hypothetical protein